MAGDECGTMRVRDADTSGVSRVMSGSMHHISIMVCAFDEMESKNLCIVY